MPLEHDVIQSIAQILYSAMKNGTTIAPLTDQYPNISVDDAYHISKQVLQLRMDNDNELVVGKKIGVTSSACLLYTSPSPRDRTRSRMPSSA